MGRRALRVSIAVALFVSGAGQGAVRGGEEPRWQAFLEAAGSDQKRAQAALAEIGARWRDPYGAMIIDMLRFMPSPRADQADDGAPPALLEDAGNPRPVTELRRGGPPSIAPSTPGADTRRRLIAFLERQARQRHGDDLRAWRKWVWALLDAPHADYASFKADLYGRVDAQFRAFFPPRVKSKVRLDEVEWGGVTVNGIPPLRTPKTIAAAEATWLRDDHIVFGLAVNGQARAYPKRILAWHEMATDRVGGVDLTIVYCTLCGTVIPYESDAGGRSWTFGTSGLLYRSNKLMLDEQRRVCGPRSRAYRWSARSSTARSSSASARS